jgi:hypothetical protein
MEWEVARGATLRIKSRRAANLSVSFEVSEWSAVWVRTELAVTPPVSITFMVAEPEFAYQQRRCRNLMRGRR